MSSVVPIPMAPFLPGEDDSTLDRGIPPQKFRGGFSLLELLITLAIIAAIAGLTLPSLRGPLEKSRLSGAGRQLRSFIATARVAAIRLDAPVTLELILQTGHCSLMTVPELMTDQISVVSDDSNEQTPSGLSAAEDSFAADGAHGVSSEHSSSAPRIIRDWTLPDGVSFSRIDFVSAVQHQQQRASRNLPDSGQTRSDAFSEQTVSSADRTEKITFLPAGRTRDAVIRLSGPQDYAMDVIVRGLTGSVTIEPPFRVDRRQSVAGLDASESVVDGSEFSASSPETDRSSEMSQ